MLQKMDYYCNFITKYDLLNRFFYKNITELPKLKKIILNFRCKISNVNRLNVATTAMALKKISGQLIKLNGSKKANKLFRIRKGRIIGCETILRNKNAHTYIYKLLFEVFPKLRKFYGIKLSKKNTNALTYKLKTPFDFIELDEEYDFYKHLPTLNTNFITNTKNQKELAFILNTYSLPLIHLKQTQKIKKKLHLY